MATRHIRIVKPTSVDLYDALAAEHHQSEAEDLSPTAAMGYQLAVGFFTLCSWIARFFVWFTRPRTLVTMALLIAGYFALQLLRTVR